MTRLPVFPFVVGCPRSGTTLMRAMLNAHPDIAVVPENNVVRVVVRRGHTHVVDGVLNLDALVDDIRTNSSIHEWELPEAVFDAVRAEAPATPEDVVRSLFARFAGLQEKPAYADKTPRNLLIIDEIAAALPESRFVHLVRDARNVAPSWAAANFGPETVVDAATAWNSWVHHARAAAARLGPARYHEVRYEDLTTDPESTMRAVCAFFDIEFAPEMLEYHTKPEAVLTQVRNPHLHEHIREPPRANIRNWETALTTRQVAEIELVAGEGLRAYGYQLSGQRIGMGVVARVRGRELGRRARTRADEAVRTTTRRIKAVRRRLRRV
jgi:hypothetical protein